MKQDDWFYPQEKKEQVASVWLLSLNGAFSDLVFLKFDLGFKMV